MTSFCRSCGTELPDQNAALCQPCSRRQETPILERRTSDEPGFFARTWAELKVVGIGNLIPFSTWMSDKPWNLLWVRWFVGVALFPLFLCFWAASARLEFPSIAFLFGLYFALMWAVVLYFMLLPRLAFSRILQVGLFTMTVGIGLALLLQQLPFISSLYDATNSASIFGRLVGFVGGVGVVEEITKILPIWWLYVHKKNKDGLGTIVFLGCVSGFAFGVAEAVNYSLSYALGLKFGMLNSGDYLIVQLTRLITLPLIHAVWTGIFAYFAAVAYLNRHVERGLLAAGLICAATLHGLYDSFSNSLLGVMIAVLSILMFLAYYRSGQKLQAGIGSLSTNQAPLPEAA